MFNFENIDEYQLEITTYCNAACPQCPRNLNGYGINPHMPLSHLDRQVIDRAFTKDLCQRLRLIFFCGGFGEPVMHPEFLDILRDFRKKNPTLWLYFHSNGGAHDPEYWAEIANIMSGYGQVDFGIDGVDNQTLGYYRRHVKYTSVIENARSFIQAGGRAQWNFIVFKHNEHQVDQAKKISQDEGFFNILVRKTGRFFNATNLEEMPQWPVENKEGVEYYLEPPVDKSYKNASMLFLPDLKKQYPNMKDYFDTTTIKCDALLGKKVSINASGIVVPCNFLYHHLYDKRFFDDSTLPGAYYLTKNSKGTNQVRDFLESYGLENLNINYQTLEEIFKNKMWSDLVNSFNSTIDQGRLFECAMTCGSKLTKVWDQGGSKKL
jgi:MoaA/NifB/PqqE/SkfB family radical SAM enzyme